MRDYLLFRLHGALASWGDIAVGDIRPSYRHPSKSAVIGLIAAALGVEREKYEKQSELAKLSFSVRIDATGVPIDDYHTVQAPSEQAIKHDRGKNFWTRIDEIEAINSVLLALRAVLKQAQFNPSEPTIVMRSTPLHCQRTRITKLIGKSLNCLN